MFETFTIKDLLITIGISIGLFLLGRLLLGLLFKHLEKISQKTSSQADDLFLEALRKTRTTLLFLLSVWLGAQWMDMTPRLDRFVDRAGFFILVIQIALWADCIAVGLIVRFGKKRTEKDSPQSAGILWVSYLVRVALWSIASLLVIANLGYDVTALIAGLGIGGIAIGLAVQNILSDLFASLSIVLDKPFVVGDFIIVGDLLGSVEKIGIKTTRVRSLSGEQLVFSNSDLLSSRIRNFKRMYERRVVFGFGVIYQTTPEQLEEIPGLVKTFIEQEERSRFDRAHFKAFGASSYDFEVVYYVLDPDYALYMDIQQAINLKMVRAFAERGIQFAYPTRTLYLQKGDSDE